MSSFPNSIEKLEMIVKRLEEKVEHLLGIMPHLAPVGVPAAPVAPEPVVAAEPAPPAA